MNLQALRTFLTIVETGSLVRASETLNVTQSTVTARLKTLEEELGQTLLVRNKSGATMTAAGLKLHRYADAISNLWQQARQDVALPVEMSGVCNLACEFELWPAMGETFMNILTQAYPDVGMSIWLGNKAEVSRWMDEGKSDLAFTYRSAVESKQHQIEMTPDRLVLVSTQENGPIRFDPRYVYIEAGENFGREHALAYADAGTARISFGNAQTGLDHVLQNGGSAYLPLRMVRDHLNSGALHLLASAPEFERKTYLTYDKTQAEGWHWLTDILDRIAAHA